jgi:sugar fermentation stimulation protein A
MKYSPPLQSGVLIQRYKRFLVDLRVNKEVLTVHCANTGRMTGCAEPNVQAYYTSSDNPKRKYPHSLELTTSLTGDLICVNTARANEVAFEAIRQGIITQLSGYDDINREVRYGQENSRIDLLLSAQNNAKPNCYVEVKSVTLLDNGLGYFPDAPSTRGQKHLRELIEMKAAGHRAMLLFISMHNGINSVQPAVHIDPQYSQWCMHAHQAGVEFLAYRCEVSQEGLKVTCELPVLGF